MFGKGFRSWKEAICVLVEYFLRLLNEEKNEQTDYFLVVPNLISERNVRLASNMSSGFERQEES